MRARLTLMVLTASLCAACTQTGRVGQLGAALDADLRDANDAGSNDAGLNDAGLNDAGLDDAGLSDAGLTDAGPEVADGGVIAACDLACQRGVTCVGGDAVLLADCREGCRIGFADTILMCDARRVGCTYPAECMDGPGGPSPRDDCEDGCGDLAFFDCIDASGVSECVAACATATDVAVRQFNVCVVGICSDDSCFAALVPDGPTNVGGCQSACDMMELAGCIGAAQLTDCRSRCTTASRADVNAFIACNEGICDGIGCYSALRDAT